MNNKDLKGTVIDISVDVLKFELDFSTNFRAHEGWDSLKMLNLILAIEEEFDVTFSSEDIEGLCSVKDIYQILLKNDVSYSRD